LKARKVVGEIFRPSPAASSRALTPSIVVLGCSFSVQPASRSPSGVSTRWLKGSCCWPSRRPELPVGGGASDGGAPFPRGQGHRLADHVGGSGEAEDSEHDEDEHWWLPPEGNELFQDQDPNAIITRPTMISVWPVDVL
jgi:hypothetical protein